MSAFPEFRPRPPWWTGDLQTLRNTILRRRPDLPSGERLTLPMNDGSGDALPTVRHPGRDDRPAVLLIHGLTGCEDSAYLRDSARFWIGRGHTVYRLNLRGAGPAARSCRGRYHAGRSEDLARILSVLPKAPHGFIAVGYSLGGNMLAKFMAEEPDSPIRAAATVSAPIDLAATSRRFVQPRNMVYHRWLLERMKAEVLSEPNDLSDAEKTAVREADTVIAFDDGYVGPHHGFDDAWDYYARCSAMNYLNRVRGPLILVHATDDPWIPARVYRDQAWADNPALTVALAAGGGHVGFHAADDGDYTWSDRRIAAFLKERGIY